MADYIERDALTAELNRLGLGEHSFVERIFADGVYAVIESMPAADVAPVVHGRWEPTKTPFMNECEDCSVCGYRTIWGHGFNYCPNCGARMDGKDGGEIG